MQSPTTLGTAAFSVHLSTPPGVGGVAIVELFGGRSESALGDAFRPKSGVGLPPPEATRFGVLLDPRGEAIDDVIVSNTSPSESWCGLAGWSISCHGGPAVTDRVLRALTGRGGVRRSTADLLADGCSTGALDSVSGQAYSAFLEARSERAAHYFFAQYRGAFTRRLLGLLQLFPQPDGGDKVLNELDRMLREARDAIRLGDPARVLIAGRANVGKSTLFNALLGQERVAVSGIEGTTRDLIAETIDICGYPVTLIDSAGLRQEEADDPVERAGIQRALAAPRDAVLFVRDDDGPLSPAEREFLDPIPAELVLTVRTKCDVVEPAKKTRSSDICAVSGQSGAGLDDLRDAIRSAWLGPREGEEIPPLPFTMQIQQCTERLRDSWSGSCSSAIEPTLDGLRSYLIECFPGLPDVTS